MKKLISTFAVALSLASLTLSAAYDISIEKKEGQPLKGQYISADPNGDISYKDGQFTVKVKATDIKVARLAKVPDEIAAADKKFADQKYADAMADYKNLYTQFKFVGFDVYCLLKECACLEKLGKKDDALTRLKTLDTYQTQDPKKMPDLFEAKKLQATIMIDLNNFDDALKVLPDLGNSDDENLAAFSFNARGDILLKQGKKKEAVLKYMIPALIFSQQNKERARALCQTANILKELNDNRSAKFADLLKKDYPDSPLVKELK